jgi:DNA ligase (NAD+)
VGPGDFGLDHPKNIEGWINWVKKECESDKYPIDGCVIGYDDVEYGDSLGATGHHLRSQLAYKFYDELYETKLLDIEWTMGKTNTLTPTAVFETINIDGTDVSKASLHNISIIKKLGLTNNCTVRVYKANQIIPQVDSCLQDGDSAIKIPKYCPVCGGLTEIVKENESEVLMCTNPNCSGKLLGRLKFFVSKQAMNIEGLSEATIERFIKLGWLTSFKDIFALKDHFTEMMKLDGFGEKSATKLLDAIEKSRDVKLENFICALSIDGVGKSTSKAIADYFKGNIAEWLRVIPVNYTVIADIGKTTSNNINEYLLKYKKDIMELVKELTFILPQKKETKENPFNDKSVAVTGKLVHFTRDSINAKLESLGAKPASGVSAKTDYLINNDPTSSSSKNKKANELNIPIITEEEFLKMCGE